MEGVLLSSFSPALVKLETLENLNNQCFREKYFWEEDARLK